MVAPGVPLVETLENLPDLCAALTPADAEGRHLGARLHYPRTRDTVEIGVYLFGVEDPCELRVRDSDVAREIAHAELVAEAEAVGIGDAGHLQVLPRLGRSEDVEFVEADDAVDRTLSRDVRNGPHVVDGCGIVAHGLDVTQRRPDPTLVEQFVARHERHMPARLVALLEELVPLVLRCDADYVTLA